MAQINPGKGKIEIPPVKILPMARTREEFKANVAKMQLWARERRLYANVELYIEWARSIHHSFSLQFRREAVEKLFDNANDQRWIMDLLRFWCHGENDEEFVMKVRKIRAARKDMRDWFRANLKYLKGLITHGGSKMVSLGRRNCRRHSQEDASARRA